MHRNQGQKLHDLGSILTPRIVPCRSMSLELCDHPSGMCHVLLDRASKLFNHSRTQLPHVYKEEAGLVAL